MTPTCWNGGYVGTTSPSEPEFRLLLDQGFPKPPKFDLRILDKTIEIEHLSGFDPLLSEHSTPDWFIYVRAAEAGFDAMVTRDESQTSELAEMWVLTRLHGFSVITWKRGIDDPIREWGQLLAYLPEIKKKLREKKPKVIRLPAPSLSKDNLHLPNKTLSQWAKERKVSVREAGIAALDEIHDWLALMNEPVDRCDSLLGVDKARAASKARPASLAKAANKASRNP